MSALTDPSKASSAAPGIGGGESQNSAPMQTIIFENTNFKGRQQGGPGASPAPMPSGLITKSLLKPHLFFYHIVLEPQSCMSFRSPLFFKRPDH